MKVLKTLAKWWETGKNVRVPDEDNAPWLTLIRDDLGQLTYSDMAFESGKISIWEWRPLYAFTPKMLKTGPTPLVRQLFQRSYSSLLELGK